MTGYLDGFLETLEGADIDGLILIDQTQTVLLFSRGAERLFGYDRSEVEGGPLSVLMPQRFHAAHDLDVRAFATGSELARTMGSKRHVFGRRKSGEEFLLDASIYRFGPAQAPTMAALLREAAAFRSADAEAMQQLAIIAEAGIGFFSHNHRTGAVFCSEALAILLGVQQGPLAFAALADKLEGTQAAWFLEALKGRSSGTEGPADEQEHVFLDASGEKRCVAVRARTQWIVRDGATIPSRTVGVAREETPRRQREDQQRFLLALADVMRRENRPEALTKSACFMLREHLEADRVVFTDIDGADFTTRDCCQTISAPFPSHGKLADFGEAFIGAYSHGDIVAVADIETDARITPAERVHFRRAGIGSFASVILQKEGRCVAAVGAHRRTPHLWRSDERALLSDVVERVWSATQTMQAQRALVLSEARIRAAAESSSAGLCETDPDTGLIRRCNAAFAAMIGESAAALSGHALADHMHPSDRGEMLLGYRRLRDQEIKQYRAERRFVRSDGSAFTADLTANLAFNGDGAPLLVLTVLRDVTEAVRTRQELALARDALETRVASRTQELETAMRRREEALEALARAQRLEAIGRLTGGVVHDSNNMLTLIAGHLEMMEDLKPNERLQRHMREAQGAVEKLRQLNRRLLTFARKRRLEPAPLDLNAQIHAMSDMLPRVLGAGVTLSISLADAPCMALADAMEVDNALLNLAINARDAMPEGGTLRMATEILELQDNGQAPDDGLPPGRYAVVSVADAGAGIPKDVLPHVFEPFFTTKAVGVGTGLGLATVYGFMKQSGGQVLIESEEGVGTTVKLFFPLLQTPAVAPEATEAGAIALGQGELILVVEDDPPLRQLTTERLIRLGYTTREAWDGPSALVALDKGDPIALVFSDVVLPGGMSGFDLADHIAQQRPHLKILLTSGFDMGVAQKDRAARGLWKILAKPYDQAALARALRTALAS